MNTVEIRFDENGNVYLRVNYGEWSVKHWRDLTEYERVLIRSLQPESDTVIVSHKMTFEDAEEVETKALADIDSYVADVCGGWL